MFVDMGRHQAVANMLGLRLRGFPAWFAARTYHLAMLPGMGRRVRLMVDWTAGCSSDVPPPSSARWATRSRSPASWPTISLRRRRAATED